MLGFGVAAWYFSSEIYDGTLQVEDRSATAETNPAYAYPDEPEAALGPEAREVAIETPLGSFPAWYATGPRAGEDTWVILTHGRGASRTETFRAAAVVHGAGFPVLSITYRNDVGAPADPRGEYAFGLREWRELEAAVVYARDQGAADVILGGFSMGAAIVVHFMENSTLADEVSGIFLDSPAIDLEASVEEGASHRRMPVVGGALPDALVEAARALASLRFDLDWDEVDVVEEAAEIDLPMLVFHGVADETVPVAVSEELKALDPTVRLERFQGADHVRSWNEDRRRYALLLTEFLRAVSAK